MPKPEKVILVCNKQRPPGHPRGCCAEKGAGDLGLGLSQLLDEKGLLGKVALTSTGCLGPCSYGPIVAVMPDNIWYKEVITEELKEIVEGHIIGGNPVARLLLEDDEWG